MRILITRPEPDAAALAHDITSLGHEPVIEPLLRFTCRPIAPDAFDGARAVAVTSGNALRALQEAGPLQDVVRLPLLCVGAETARKARALGFQTIVATAETAEELAEILKRDAQALKLTPVIHVTGMHQAFDLAKALDGHGLSIRTLSVYGMEARRAFSESLLRELKAGRIDGTILMSARTAEILVSLCRKHDVESHAAQLLHFCLSTAVAERLAPLKPVNVRVAERPTRAALLSLIAATRAADSASFSDHD
jgi:uroporphyrinogen-III synthase